jgi:hypothetical protein
VRNTSMICVPTVMTGLSEVVRLGSDFKDVLASGRITLGRATASCEHHCDENDKTKQGRERFDFHP